MWGVMCLAVAVRGMALPQEIGKEEELTIEDVVDLKTTISPFSLPQQLEKSDEVMSVSVLDVNTFTPEFSLPQPLEESEELVIMERQKVTSDLSLEEEEEEVIPTTTESQGASETGEPQLNSTPIPTPEDSEKIKTFEETTISSVMDINISAPESSKPTEKEEIFASTTEDYEETDSYTLASEVSTQKEPELMFASTTENQKDLEVRMLQNMSSDSVLLGTREEQTIASDIKTSTSAMDEGREPKDISVSKNKVNDDMDGDKPQSSSTESDQLKTKASSSESPQSENYLDNEIDIDTLDDSDILDVVKNFIAEQDPILELYLSLCFLHPDCYQLDVPVQEEQDLDSPRPPPSLESEQARQLWGHLKARRTESARNLLVGLIKQLKAKNKQMMFRYMQEGVAARGVSIAATRNIIDSLKNIWESVNKDLDEAKRTVEELFLLPLNSEAHKRSLIDVVSALLAIPGHTEGLYQKAATEGYRNYLDRASWDSWKRQD